MRRLNSLDGLRALAVLLVFVYHVRQQDLTGGFVGVDVFFVLSGYLITALLVTEFAATGTIWLPGFYARRALRLYPALVCVVTFGTITNFHFGLGSPAPDGVFAMLYVTDFSSQWSSSYQVLLHTWSLAVEEQFYLVWPAALLLALRRRSNLTAIVLTAAGASVLVTAGLGIPHLALRMQFLPTSHLGELGGGALLAISLRDGNCRWVNWIADERLAAGCVIAIAACVVWLPDVWWAYPAATLICVPLVAHLITKRTSLLSRCFSVRPMVWLGVRSYGFYLWHYPILIWTKGTINGHDAILTLAVTLGVTELSWRLVETPFLKLKGRFESRPARGVVRAQT